jgi:hypothetical protein
VAKAKPFKRASPPNLAGKRPSDEITRAELVALVVQRISRNRIDHTTLSNRVSSKACYDTLRTRKLRPAASGRFALGAVADWTAQQWPGYFNDLPTYPRTVDAAITEAGDTGLASGCVLPQSLETAHREIIALYVRNDALAQALTVAQGQLRDDAPVAEKWRGWHGKKRSQRDR